MTGKSKLILALLGIAFLLFNPAGVCAGTPPAHAPAHPCCPSPSNQHGNGTGACVCIDRQPAAPALPSPDTSLFTPAVATQALALASVFADETVAAPGGSGFTLAARFLTFHQILV